MGTTNIYENVIHKETNIFLEKLEKIWDQIGMDPEVRRERLEIISMHVKDIYKEVLTEAKDDQRHLLESIEGMLQEIDKLKKELRIRNVVESYENVPFIQVKKDLKHKIKM